MVGTAFRVSIIEVEYQRLADYKAEEVEKGNKFQMIGLSPTNNGNGLWVNDQLHNLLTKLASLP